MMCFVFSPLICVAKYLKNVLTCLFLSVSVFSTVVQKHKENGGALPPEQTNHLESLIQLEPAIGLILQTVEATMGDQQAQIFGKQVLDATIEFLYVLLLDGLSLLENCEDLAEKEDLQQATGKSTF